jgi:hypothetical protein
MGETALLRSFAAGELDPGLSLRIDVQAYTQGLRTCRNFMVRRSGGVRTRPGLEHVADAKYPTQRTMLYPFIFAAADENYLVEAGELYFRFHHPVRGMVLELVTPYTTDNLEASMPLYWHQSGLGVTLTHHLHPPMQLRYTAPDTFVLETLDLTPGIDPPTGLDFTASTTSPDTEHPSYVHSYQITAVSANYEESLPTAATEIASVAGTPDAPILLEWDAVAGAIEYKVYRDDGQNNTHGYLGTATGQVSFNDIGVEPDMALTPPTLPALFDAENKYPLVNAVHKQRRVFAGTDNLRDELFASRIGHYSNFSHRSPFQDDDAMHWRHVSKDVQCILHLVSLGPLIALTDRGEWVVRGDQDGALTPMTINPEQRGYIGSGWAVPVVYGERVLFVQARQATIREFLWDAEVEGLSGRDLSQRASHLFRGKRCFSIGFALIPDAVLWCVRDDGVLLGLTYIPDEDVIAWHRHDTDGGNFEQVCVLPEDTEDVVYVVVERDGDRSIERMTLRDPVAAWLDRRVRVRGTGLTTLTGLTHLAGEDVVVVADGQRLRERHRVSATGELTLPRPADVVDVGQPITATLETLELDTVGTTVRDQRKKVTSLAILVEDSLQNFEVGPDLGHLLPVQAAPWEDAGARKTGRIELTATSYFNDDGRVVLRHTEPTTLTVLGLLPNVDVGG